jgi:hypothetical protein
MIIPARCRVLGRLRVNAQRLLAQRIGQPRADELDHLLVADVDVVADSSFVAGVKIAVGSFSHCRSPGGSFTPHTLCVSR